MAATQVRRYRAKPDAPYQVFEPAPAQLPGASYATRTAQKFQLKINTMNENEMIFDLSGVDVSIANALRRVLLSELPSMAIETAYIYNNTSVIQDEVLAHRMGLIPIKANPRAFSFQGGDETHEGNTTVFKLAATCDKRGRGQGQHNQGTEARDNTMHVYSGDMEWVPVGDQRETFPEGLRPVHEDILIAKLAPGQTIQMELHCVKGIGRNHAKYSPVATAFYRLLPDVKLKQKLTGELAHELVKKCPMNVFEIEDSGKGLDSVKVVRPRDCSMCRECIREPGWDQRVQLERVADHFIFSIESEGALPPSELLREAVGVLKDKCQAFLLETQQQQDQDPVDQMFDGH